MKGSIITNGWENLNKTKQKGKKNWQKMQSWILVLVSDTEKHPEIRQESHWRFASLEHSLKNGFVISVKSIDYIKKNLNKIYFRFEFTLKLFSTIFRYLHTECLKTGFKIIIPLYCYTLTQDLKSRQLRKYKNNFAVKVFCEKSFKMAPWLTH